MNNKTKKRAYFGMLQSWSVTISDDMRLGATYCSVGRDVRVWILDFGHGKRVQMRTSVGIKLRTSTSECCEINRGGRGFLTTATDSVGSLHPV